MTPHRPPSLVAVTLLVVACSRASETVSPVPRSEVGSEPAPGDDATQRQITITMTAETADALAKSGASIYGLRAVEATNLAGSPLLWFATKTYSLTTTLSWREEYQAYTSTESMSPGVTVDASASYDIALGQILTVLEETGTGAVSTDGTAGKISILNQTTTPFQSGLAQGDASGSAPFCVFPLQGGELLQLTPRPTVFLMVSSDGLSPSSVVESSSGPGVLLDFTGATERAVSYDLNEGWSFGAAPWGTVLPTGSDLVSRLVVPP